MLWAVWIGLAMGVLAVVAGAVHAVRGVLEAFRSLKALKHETAKALEQLTHAAEKLAGHPDAAAKLSPALARLGHGRTRLNVLLAAVDDVRASLGRVTAFYPRK